MLYFLQQVLNGLHSGAIYALLAFGYVLTNGVLKRTNLAFGPLFAFAGQALILVAVFGWYVLWLTLAATIALGILAGFAYAALIATVLSRSVFQPLAATSPNANVVATLGAGIALMELARIAAETRDLWLPPILSQPVVFLSGNGFPVTLTVIQLINCAIAVIAVTAAAAYLARSRAGRYWRATGDDPGAAALCGIDVSKVFHVSVLGGALFAALAGSEAALYYGNISFGTGLFYGLKILFVTAVGGYRAPLSAAAGAACFGIGESLWAGYFPIEWRDGWMFAFLIALLVLTGAGKENDTRQAV